MAMTFGTSGTMADEVINGQFLQNTKGWTLGANWALSSSPRGLKHTAGAIESVGQDLTGATATTVTYDFKVFTSGITAGSIVVTAGSGDVGVTITTNGWHNWQVVFNVNTTLGITPSTDFDGTVELVVVRKLRVQP